MFGIYHLALPSSSSRSPLRACWLGLSLATTMAGPAVAAGDSVTCVPDSKASPTELIAACTPLADNTAAPRSDRATALVARAVAHGRTSGSLTEALADLDRAIALDGKNGVAYRLRGDMTREAGGDLGRAEADLSKAIALDAQDAEAYEQRGIVYTNQHRFERALADYGQAIRLKPDYAQAYSDRGATYYLGGDIDKALADYDEALRIEPNRPRTLSNRAAAYKKLGELDKALADDNEAIRLDAKQPEYFDNRGLTYQAMHDYDHAIDDYDQAIRMEQRANFYTNRGDSYQFKGELGTALDNYNTALRLDPKFELAYNNRAVLYKKMGERTKALSDYEAALRLDPGNENAADGRRAMIAEIARVGGTAPAPLAAPEPHPSFDCTAATLAVEKTICADPQLGALDRQIADVYARLIHKSGSRSASALRLAQRNFIAERNAGFGKPGYDLRLAMERRLDALGGTR